MVTYRRAHCCSNVASRAHVRLITKLSDQSELTKTADFGAEKGGGCAGVARIDVRDTFGLARSW